MKKKIFTFMLLIMVMVLILVVCNHKYQFNTLSGKPETIVKGVKKDKIINVLNNKMINRGYHIKNETKHQITYAKLLDDSLQASIFFGSEYDSTPEYRISYSFVKYKNKIRIIATLKVVTNPNSAYEKVTDRTNTPEGKRYMKMLRNLKNSLNN